jgi:oligopeptide transport system substrate-binding protein
MPDGSKNPLGDVRVRKALSLAVDRQTIVEKITQMRQPIAGTFVPPDMIPGYAPPPRERKLLDIDRAKALLKDAGYTDPATLTGVTILYNTGGGHEQTMQAIKRMWQDNLGVVVNLEAMEVRSFRERLKTQKYTTARASWIGDYRDPTTFLDKYRTGGGNNDSKWSNAEYDALLNQAAGERDEAARMVLLRRAEAILLAEQPILPLYHYITLHVYDPDKVRNLHLNAWNFLRLDLVRVQP